MAKGMTTHELARELLRLPDVPVYRHEPTHNYWGQVLAVPVRGIDEARVSAEGGTIREDEESCEPDDVTAFVIG